MVRQQVEDGGDAPGPVCGSSTTPVSVLRRIAPKCTTYHTPRHEISEAMPKMDEQMKYMVRIESLNSQEGDHQRGTYRMLTGYPPSTVGIKHPHLGAGGRDGPADRD